MLTTSKFMLILLSIIIMVRCVRSMLREHYEPETWAYIRSGRETLPVYHWENIIGSARSADLVVDKPGVRRVHAVLTRSDAGQWRVFDVFGRGGVWVNSVKVGPKGEQIFSGDVINLVGNTVRFQDIPQEKRVKLEASRATAGKRFSPALTLLELTLFQLFLLLQHALFADEAHLPAIALGFLSLIMLQWSCYNAMRIMGRSGFEVETLAFYLTTLGMSVAATSTPDDMFKQILLTIAAVALFLLNGWWLRSLKRTAAMRFPIAAAALLLLAVNVVASDAVLGARNWLELGGFSFQPSELVKVAYVYVGASTLEKLFRRRNLFGFIAFSAICVVALALIGDFGTALVFFISFLVISYMRSGSIATVFLAVSGAGLAGFLAVSARPYIAQRFASWGHVWEDVYDAGYQQTRAMSAAAAGGLFGKGAGSGWLKDIFAANTDMVFAVICEELGLIIGLCAILAMLTLAFFAVRSARNGRSSYYAIAACSAMSMLLTQLALNVFGSMDILPFTGVTFPFVSRGGTSLLSCWMLMAFIKGADTRRDASFAVRPGERLFSVGEQPEKAKGGKGKA
ncbi:MAG: FtsW/RodA/SpoVE family cell cycle protein [Oscillospiraceae bacterium]|nr:FtsW/RodA/SpoVE family cell cycle protein [Oscillospiraceae bacterium]